MTPELGKTSAASDPAAISDRRRYLQLAARHYENFPVGSLLLPRRARRHLHRIYAFARTADDLADELRDRDQLLAYRADFLAHVAGERRDVALFVDLVDTMRACELPTALFTDLLDAFEQDLDVGRYTTEAQLRDYCRRSADPVGRLVLRVCGHRDSALDRLSDHVCTALQLLNHLQDIGADLRDRDRIYFPREALQRHGVAEADLRLPAATPAVRAFVLEQADAIGREFALGFELTRRVRGRLRYELRAILHGAAAVLRRIRRAGGDVLGTSTKLGARERIAVLWRGLCQRRPPTFGGER